MSEIGKIFHGLTILDHCGSGAYGDVYYCSDISGHKMAIKILSKEKLGEIWHHELQGVTCYRKVIENIVWPAPPLLQLFHVEEDSDYFFYTMEAADSIPGKHCRADTLAKRLVNGPLPQNELFDVLSGVFSGIKTIHDAGFAHRDIKPDNILFVKGIPKIGDIGLISALAPSTRHNVGTTDFLPPESRTTEGNTTKQNSPQYNDLYAFGKLIYCAVTAEEPQAWPSIPKWLTLSLPTKLFLHLSFRLCEVDSMNRINTASQLEREMLLIKQALKKEGKNNNRLNQYVEKIWKFAKKS